MESIREQLTAKGFNCTDYSDEKCREVAKVLGIDVPRTVEIVEHKGAQYLKTESFTVPHKSDPTKKQQARNLFIRVEAIPQAIQDLTAGLSLVNSGK